MTPLSDSQILAAAAIVGSFIASVVGLAVLSRLRRVEGRLNAISALLASAANERAEILEWVRAEQQRRRLAETRREQRALRRGDHERH